ncbi:MAG TPA: aldo/keto reductase [Candidatus Bathyarchaeia archaeon]|nr:aldo/keto reductase [Candidatus Bathyarchaeia archaeon]
MNTIELPKIGLGTMFANSEKAKEGLIKALQIGFRFIDTAQIYFNEKTVGMAIKESGISRDDLTIATKLWISNFKPSKVIKSTVKSLERLGLDHVDLLYLHWPFKFQNVEATFKEMNKLIKMDKIKHIAVSNYTPELIDKALSLCESPIIANQIEMHPWLQQKELLLHHKSKNVKVVAYYPIMHGQIRKVPEILQVAAKHKVSPYQVSLAWIMEKEAIPIPKSVTESHLQDNFNSINLKLEKNDIELIDSITIQKRLVKPSFISPKGWKK